MDIALFKTVENVNGAQEWMQGKPNSPNQAEKYESSTRSSGKEAAKENKSIQNCQCYESGRQCLNFQVYQANNANCSMRDPNTREIPKSPSFTVLSPSHKNTFDLW